MVKIARSFMVIFPPLISSMSFIAILLYECEFLQYFEQGKPEGYIELFTEEDRKSDVLSRVIFSSREETTNAIFVVSLQGTPGANKRNQLRLDKFRDIVRDSCGGNAPEIIHCPGIDDNRRGYGLTAAHLICFRKAIEMDQEVSFFFEDDARPFQDDVKKFCELISASMDISEYSPGDSMLTFLGGHHWQTNELSTRSNLLESYFSFGTYAFAVPRRTLKLLLVNAENDLVNGFRDEKNKYLHSNFLSPERSWYRLAQTLGLKVYLINPLLVWHEKGYSNTWKMERTAEFGKTEQIATGSFANCSLSGNNTHISASEMIALSPRDPLNSVKRVSVSCRSFAYKIKGEVLGEVRSNNAIIVGVLSHAKQTERRQVSHRTKIDPHQKHKFNLHASPTINHFSPSFLGYSRDLGGK